jgi:DUF1365 family protein
VKESPRPSLYVGTLHHRRFTPADHAFTYPLFMALLDIDRIPELMRVSRFTSYNRWNWASFHDTDHFGDPARPLRERLAVDAVHHGLDLPGGRILLLTHLRYLGYCFNPVSFFYCFDRTAVLRLVVAEVNNTFGGSHNYWLEPDSDDLLASGVVAQPTSLRLVDRTGERTSFRSSTPKSFYVSPFMPARMDYTFVLTPPDDRLTVQMNVYDRSNDSGPQHDPAGGRTLEATLSLIRQPWTANGIGRLLRRHPAVTAKVMIGIHWQACRLWWKGVPFIRETTR